jgi:peptidoglycan/xylan/chitin deacetylase (PgdA/CDA1 family)
LRIRYASSVAGAALGVATLRYAIRGRASQCFGPSVYHGDRSRRSIALTFDDGPSPGTLAIADYLAEQDVRATFFQCGSNILRHRGISSMLHQAGHELGNHTYSHARLCPRLGWHPNLLPANVIYEEFARTQHILKEDCGVQPRLMRAPYGFRWFGVGAAQRRLGLLGVMWTSIGHDWAWKADQVAEKILREASAGGILCLHDGRDTRPNPDISETIQAIQTIVPRLKDQGYRFETVSDLLRRQPVPVPST